MITFENYFVNTYGVWITCERPQRKPDFKSGSSKYWDCGDKVIRESDHWGVVGTCFWKIDCFPIKGIFIQKNCGMIAYSNFQERILLLYKKSFGALTIKEWDEKYKGT